MGKDYFGTHKHVPDLPTLFVLPLPIVYQWRREIKRFFVKGSFDIFILPQTLQDVDYFFKNSQSPWNISKQTMINRVVLCAESVSIIEVLWSTCSAYWVLDNEDNDCAQF